MPTEDASQSEDSPAEKTTRRLLSKPERFGPCGECLLWVEVIGDEPETMIWEPDTEAERREVERFWEAACKIDWDDPAIHDVEY